METRRSFIKIIFVILISSAIFVEHKMHKVIASIKGRQPKNVLVLWFSQTGHTKRNGQLIAHTWKKLGLNVTASEMREFKRKSLRDFDLVVIGTPVFYYDIPGYVKNWIMSLPRLNETPVASFVTFGGPEGDQHNAACTILELLSERGGVPVGMETFMNMGTMPTVWSDEKVSENVWNNRHLPNEETYKKVRQYALFLVNQVKEGNCIEVEKRITLRRFGTILDLIWWTKLAIKEHAIDKDKCTQCGRCVEKCPSEALDPVLKKVYRDRCVLCFGCINNCPEQAIIMTYRGKKLFGFWELLRRKNITIKEPEELQETVKGDHRGAKT